MGSSNSISSVRTRLNWRALIIVWIVFAGICSGLAYSAISRFDPRHTGGLGDSMDYISLVNNPVPAHPESHRPFRIAMPFAARPFYWALQHHHGATDPALLAMLAMCVLVGATAATGLFATALLAGQAGTVAALAACLFTLNFWVVNHFMYGLVDIGECCAGVFLLIGLWKRQWWLVLIAAVLGAMTKETFVVMGGVMAGVWWLLEFRRDPRRWISFAAIGVSFVVALAAVLTVRKVTTGAFVSPVEMAEGFHRGPAIGFLARAREHLVDVEFWYGFYWALPLAIFSLHRVPRTWWMPALAAAVTALVLGLYHEAGAGNVARPIFSMVGPVMSAMAAITLGRLANCAGSGPLERDPD